MRPTHEYTTHQTFDLTECKVHCLVDASTGKRRVVVLVPKEWEAGERRDMPAVNGETVSMRPFRVTAWEEIVLFSE
jgi:hypothetical protein